MLLLKRWYPPISHNVLSNLIPSHNKSLALKIKSGGTIIVPTQDDNGAA